MEGWVWPRVRKLTLLFVSCTRTSEMHSFCRFPDLQRAIDSAPRARQEAEAREVALEPGAIQPELAQEGQLQGAHVRERARLGDAQVRVQLKKSKVIVLTDGCMGLEGE